MEAPHQDMGKSKQLGIYRFLERNSVAVYVHILRVYLQYTTDIVIVSLFMRCYYGESLYGFCVAESVVDGASFYALSATFNSLKIIHCCTRMFLRK